MEGCLPHSFSCDEMAVCGTSVETEFHTIAQAVLKLTASQHPEYIIGMRCYACPNFILLIIIFCMNYNVERVLCTFTCVGACSPSSFLRWVSH